MTDDPESRFRRFPWVLRRWTWRALNRRLRMPFRRRRWDSRNRRITKPYIIRKSDTSVSMTDVIYAIGDFSGRSGLSRAGIYELKRLRDEFPHIIVRDLGAAIHEDVPIIAENGPPIDRLYLLSAPDTYSILFRSLSPERLKRAYRVGLWVWETPIFPAHWRFAINLVDEIWTPSEYSRDAIAPAVGLCPVIVRPHAVVHQPAVSVGLGCTLRAQFGIAKTAFMGLAIMDISSCPARKNPWAHIAAWHCAFGHDPGCVLLIKIRVSKATRIVLEELFQMIGTAKNIRIVEMELSNEEIVALQKTTNVYLSLHRAEGYGLNVHECLSLDTLVVATDFSANAEYGPRYAGYYPVSYRFVTYQDWTGHYSDNRFNWAEVNLDECSKILQSIKNGQRPNFGSVDCPPNRGNSRAGSALFADDTPIKLQAGNRQDRHRPDLGPLPTIPSSPPEPGSCKQTADQPCQCIGIVWPRDLQPMAARQIDLKRARWLALAPAHLCCPHCGPAS